MQLTGILSAPVPQHSRIPLHRMLPCLRLAWRGGQGAAYPAAGPALRLLNVRSAAGVHADDNAPGALMPLQPLPHNACMRRGSSHSTVDSVLGMRPVCPCPGDVTFQV